MEKIYKIIATIFFVLAVIMLICAFVQVYEIQDTPGNDILYTPNYYTTFFLLSVGCTSSGLISLATGYIAEIKGKIYSDAESHNTDGNTHLSKLVSEINKISPSDGWQCKNCGRINYMYVGTCACGNTKLEND